MLFEPWSQNYGSAPLSGGSASGGDRFFVDGNFYSCDPCGLPVISFPLKGDSILSTRDILFFFTSPTLGYYCVPLGTFPNIQPWSPNQIAMVLEQDFMVAQDGYYALPLNTPYWPGWAIGFNQVMWNGYPIPSLNQFYLVEEGTLEDMGGGISKIRRKFATIPPTRNELEQFAYSYIGFANDPSGANRYRVTFNVQSRVQYDYFIFDDLNVLTTPLYPIGKRLNSTISPAGLILPPTYYWQNINSISKNIFTDSLSDGATTPPTPGDSSTTVPSFSDYTNIMKGDGSSLTSNGLNAEVIAEASTMSRYLGNIWERRTRFVIAQ